MSENEPILRIGCTVLVAAARFDDSNEDRWSVAQFGAEANTKELVCEVVSHRAGRWKVLVLFDKTYYTLEAAALKHTAGICPQCAHAGTQGPNNDISLVVGLPGVPAEVIGTGIGTGVGEDSTDDDTPFMTLSSRQRTDLQPSRATQSNPRGQNNGEVTPLEQQSAPGPSRRRTTAQRRRVPPPPPPEVLEIDDPCDEDPSEDESQREEESEEDEEVVEEGDGSGRGRGLGRGRGRGGGRGRGRGERARSPKHDETPTTVKRDRVVWTKNGARNRP